MEITAPHPSARVPLEGIDFSDPGRYQQECQHAVWQTMRHEQPVLQHRAPNGSHYWGFARYQECERIVKDHEVFGSEDGTILASVGVGDSAGGQTITLMDPPRHGAIRRPTMRTISHNRVRQRAPQIREQVRRLIAPCLEGGEHDVARMLRRLPMAVIGDLMGIPESYWDTIAFHTTASIAPEDPEYSGGTAAAETLRRVHHELFACFTEVIAHRRAHPDDDLITALTQLEVDGARMEDWRVSLNCYSFLLGANSTTPHVAAHTLWALAQHPTVWREVTAQPEQVPALVEEGARWTSPTNHLIRRVRTDTELGGTALRAGDWVCAWVASANRDEQVFSEPYRFSLQRRPNNHLSFGAGPHYCIGAPSSRLALGMLFEEVAGAIDHIELAGDPTHLYSNWINGLTSLPLRFHPRRSGTGTARQEV